MEAGEEERDVVYLYGQDTLGLVPTISPFVLKLETWLRMSDIDYQYVARSRATCKTKQHPWVRLNGEEICDTNIIIRRLSEHFGKPVDGRLSPEQRSLSHAIIRMLEEHTFQAYVWFRYVHNSREFWDCFDLKSHGPKVENMYTYVEQLLRESVKEKSWHHGIGRKAPEDIYRLAEDDLRAVSVCLGEKPFLMGTQPSLVDCAMFGLLSQLVFIPLSFPPGDLLTRDYPNLVRHTNTMRERFFADWDAKCKPSFK